MATSLLLAADPVLGCGGDRYFRRTGLIGKYSSSAHELLLQFLFGRFLVLSEVLAQQGDGQSLLDPQGPAERSPSHRLVEALGAPVTPRTDAVPPVRTLVS